MASNPILLLPRPRGMTSSAPFKNAHRAMPIFHWVIDLEAALAVEVQTGITLA